MTIINIHIKPDKIEMEREYKFPQDRDKLFKEIEANFDKFIQYDLN